MTNPLSLDTESDPRFPSGPWVGFFLDKRVPGRNLMELGLTFRNGDMAGEGRDWVGKFVIRGRYSTADGRCHWHKRYLGKHDVYYQGFNEGKGIWGTWEMPEFCLRGGFHIWPEGMADPTNQHLTEAVDPPLHVEEFEETKTPDLVPIGVE
jgi:hypothetical protein